MAKIVPILAFVVALVLGVFVVPYAIETIQISSSTADFKSTRAKVVSRNVKKQQSGPSTYEIVFEYRIGPRKFNSDNRFTQFSDNETDVSTLVRKEPQGHESILIYYDPEWPKRAVIRREVPTHWAWTTIALTALLTIASFGSFISNRKRAQVMKRVARR